MNSQPATLLDLESVFGAWAAAEGGQRFTSLAFFAETVAAHTCNMRDWKYCRRRQVPGDDAAMTGRHRLQEPIHTASATRSARSAWSPEPELAGLAPSWEKAAGTSGNQPLVLSTPHPTPVDVQDTNHHPVGTQASAAAKVPESLKTRSVLRLTDIRHTGEFTSRIS